MTPYGPGTLAAAASLLVALLLPAAVPAAGTGGDAAQPAGDRRPAGASPEAARDEGTEGAPRRPRPALRFEEMGAAAGARHVHSTRDFGDRTKAEVLEMFTDGGAAVAVGDFDGDGWDDLLLTDSAEDGRNHLLRNLAGERGEIAFEDVTTAAGVGGGNDERSIVADALWFDYDNDGHRDLLLARFGTPLLLRNPGPADGGVPRFEEVSEEAGLAGAFDNTIAAIAFDADADGWLDLVLGHYFPRENLLDLDTPHVLPEDLDDAHNGGGLSLWKNVAGDDGGRAFVEVTETAGLAGHTGWTLDLGHADLDDDGDQDLYVAGDYGTDRLFWNRGDGTFVDATEEVLGFDTRKGMNVDVGDYDRNGHLDVYVTNITDEYMRECNMLWHNLGDGDFMDLARETGTCDSDWGWAAKFADLDNDGWEDLYTVNGLRSAGEENYIPVLLEMIITPGVDFSDLHSYPDIGERTWSGYQRQRLFRNLGDGTFAEVAAEAGVDNDLDGRGIGVADLDRDGRLDLVQTNARQPSLLYRNVTEGAGNWVELRLTGAAGSGLERASNRDAIGARVVLTTEDGRQIREVNGGNGYASQSSLTVHFGLGDAERVDTLEVRWPGGRVQRLEAAEGGSAVPVNALTRIVEGEGVGRDGKGAERLARLRNLGKALYENPATQYEAVDVLAEAAERSGAPRDRVNHALALLRAGREEEGIALLEEVQEQAPEIPHTWFNLGIAYKRASRYDDAVAQLEGMVERVPDEPITRYNLGVLYKLRGEPQRALAAFERAAELDPYLAGARFQLASAYRQAGRSEAAQQAMAEFRELKREQADDAVAEDLEWSYYAELVDPREPGPPGAAPAAEPRFEVVELPRIDARSLPPGGGDGGSAGLAVLDADRDHLPDLLAWSGHGLQVLTLDPGASEPRLHPASSVVSRAGIVAAVPGDLDDDGLPDLALVTDAGVQLWRNHDGLFRLHADVPASGGGTVPAGARAGETSPPSEEDRKPPSKQAEGAGQDAATTTTHATHAEEIEEESQGDTRPTSLPAVAARTYRTAAWLDFDHDYDLDLFLLGAESALLRNVGEGRFEDHTGAFPFVDGTALSAVSLDPVPDTPGVALAVSFADRPGVLYRDLLGGRYEAVPLPDLPAGARSLIAHDLDNDGWTDLAAGGPDGPVLLRNLPDGGFAALPAPDGADGSAAPVVFLDVEGRGRGELVAGGTLWRNQGNGGFAASTPLPGPKAPVDLATADLDADGRPDLAAVTAAGDVVLLANRTDGDHHWLRVDLVGKKNLQLAPGAEVEVKAGTTYQKRIHRGAPLTFGLGPSELVDTVRITWPNGLIQNETRQEADTAVVYEEAQRLSGSCPMVFAWNGRRMEFIGDVLGVAPLGAAAGDGVYFQVDHDEVLAIGGHQLVPRDGVLDVRMTEELREVGYVDSVRLVAVDHPVAMDVFHNDRFKGPPYPELRLWGVEERVDPVAATDHRGRDVLDRVLARDRTYVDGFRRDLSGLAEPHHLTLDFGDAAPDGRALLVLHGWVDWADGSTFLATAQAAAGPRVEMPVLQVRDESGAWRTVDPEMGLPAGKPKTLVVDLAGRWLSDSRQVRIATSMCVYWDEIFLAPGDGEPTVRLTELAPRRANLRFRGFSRVEVHPQRLQPEHFVYEDVLPAAPWNPTPGRYTRFGEVGELLDEIDDRFVIFGAGDELALEFDAAALPELPAGWTRDYLLTVDGWAKDGDLNTALARSVEPLPHHAMPEYPYGPENAYPDTPEHRRYIEEWLTREPLVLTRPLRPDPEPRPADR